MNGPLWNTALDVSRGSRMPEGTSAEYGLAEASWAERCSKPGEAPHEAHARLSPSSVALRTLRVAGGIARMFEGDCDPTQLLLALGYLPESFEFKSKSVTWADLIELARPSRRDSETLGDTMRRLVDHNTSARCTFLFVISP
jgi:hypothetical protein